MIGSSVNSRLMVYVSWGGGCDYVFTSDKVLDRIIEIIIIKIKIRFEYFNIALSLQKLIFHFE